jgi:hypothetical protein
MLSPLNLVELELIRIFRQHMHRLNAIHYFMGAVTIRQFTTLLNATIARMVDEETGISYSSPTRLTKL